MINQKRWPGKIYEVRVGTGFEEIMYVPNCILCFIKLGKLNWHDFRLALGPAQVEPWGIITGT